MFYTPRFSYRCLKTTVRVAPTGTAVHASGGYGTGYVPGGYTGVGTGVGNTGVLPSSPPMPGEHPQTQRSGPVGPAGAGVVGSEGAGVTVGGDGSWRPPCGPGRVCDPPCLQDPQNAHLGPIGRDFINISVKLVKTAKCHRFSSKRPPVVPISKTGSKSQLLKN